MTAPTEPAAPAAHRYRCPACGEMMLYGEAHCDRCGEEAPVYNRPAFWRILWACVVLGVLACVALVLF